MKTFAAMVLMVICIASAQTSAQTQASSQKLKGTVTFEVLKVGGDEPDQNYHIGGDVCSPGDEHHAPECAPEPDIPSEIVNASLKLADGRVINISKTKVASAAWGEAITRKYHKGIWNVTYKVVGQHDIVYPFALVKQHHLEDIEVTFPATIKGKIYYVLNIITIDDADQFFYAVDYGG